MKHAILTAALLLAICVSVFADEAQDLNKTVTVWKTKLAMKDWDIQVKTFSLKDIMKICEEPCMAASKWNVEHKVGLIAILSRDGYKTLQAMAKEKGITINTPIKDVKADQRDSIVHEMLRNLAKNMEPDDALSVITKALKP